jgi:hypothetical protein
MNRNFEKREFKRMETFITYLDQNYSHYSNDNLFEPKFHLMYINHDFTSLIPYLQEDYSVIYSISPILNKNVYDQIVYMNKTMTGGSNDNSVDYLGSKRIRPLTPPLSAKTLTFSPYNRKSSFTPIKNNSAFKNLNGLFSTVQKDK